jgi:FkbM family methyltransferase
MADEAKDFIEIIKRKFGSISPKVILEIGSRDLDQSIQFIEAFPNARVLAFEPNPEMIPYCKQRLTQYPEIELYEYAISDEDGLIDFYVTDRWLNTGASSILKPKDDDFLPGLPWKKISGIQARRLDSLLTELGIESVDIVWIDVQGAELRALKGMGKFFDNVKMLHAEAAQRAYYEGHILKDELENWLHEKGFNTEFIGNWREHSHGEGDLVCIRKNF